MQFVLDISSDSDSDLNMDTGLKVATVDDPVLTTIKPEPVEGDAKSHLEMEPRSDTTQPKIKLEPDDEAEARLTTSIAELEAALEAKVAAENASVTEAPDGQPAVIKAAPVNSTVAALAEYLVTRPFNSGEQAKPAPITSTTSDTATAQSGVQRTATRKDDRFHPYLAPAQKVRDAPPIQPQAAITPKSVFYLGEGVHNSFGLLIERIAPENDPHKPATFTITHGHIIIDSCLIKAKEWGWGLQPNIKITARHCVFTDGAHFKGQWPLVADESHFLEVASFKANKNFTATKCVFWPRQEDEGRMTFSRTAWDSCKDCVFHGEIYINKQPAWNRVMVDSNLLLAK